MTPERGPLLEAAQDTVRKAVQWYRDGVWSVARAEHDRLMRRWGWHLDQRMAALERIADEIRAERAQLNLDLGGNNEQSGAPWAAGGTTASRRSLHGAAGAR